MLSILHLEEGDRLKKVLSPLLKISEQATITFRKDGLYLQPLYPILEDGIVTKVSVMLRLDSSGFNLYCCNESSSTAWVHLSTIGTIVNTTSDQDRITVFANFPEKLLNFTFQDEETLRARHLHSFIADVPNHYADLNESNYEYDVIIGIPSEEFRGILRIVNEIGGYAVFVHASNVQVSFISISESGEEDEEFVLKKENGECIIWGVEAEEKDPLMILMSLTYIDSYIEALEFCDSPTVWMFKSRGGQPQLRDMLVCPIGSQLQGSFNFYFFYPDRNHMEA